VQTQRLPFNANMVIEAADRKSQSSLGPSTLHPCLHPGASNPHTHPTASLCSGGASTTHSPTCMSACVSLGAPIFASCPTLQCLEFCSCGSFSHSSDLNADSAFGGGRCKCSMVSQDSTGEASTYAKRCRKGPPTGNNAVLRRDPTKGERTCKVLPQRPPTTNTR